MSPEVTPKDVDITQVLDFPVHIFDLYLWRSGAQGVNTKGTQNSPM